MRKPLLCALVLLLLAAVAFAQDGMMKEKAGDYTVEAKFDSAPPVRGTNGITIAVKDSTGKAVTDATVVVEYFMTQIMSPTQKSTQMPHMGYHAPAVLKNSVYKADLDLWMSGQWHIDVRVIDKALTSKASFFLVVK
jgi:hypothetical protein